VHISSGYIPSVGATWPPRTIFEDQPFLMNSVPLFCHAKHGECLRAALCNAVEALAGGEEAMRILRLGPVSCESLARAGQWLEERSKRYRLENVKVLMHLESEGWLHGTSKGIFLARLPGVDKHGEEVDHVVVINADKGLVKDSAEVYAMLMKHGVLEACVGDGFQLVGLKEAKQLTRQTFGKKKRKKRKLPYEKRLLIRKAKEDKKSLPDGDGMKKEKLKIRVKQKKRILSSDDDGEI